MSLQQPDLFEAPSQDLAGFRYQDDFLSSALEQETARRFGELPFKPFEFHGYLGNRRVVSFGWRYDYGARTARPAEPIPEFLLAIRDQAAAWAKLPVEGFRQALVTEYAPGAGIGWHRDKPVYGEVLGISLLSPCTMRFRRAAGDGWERRLFKLQPRSIYILQGPARSHWEHSIPEVTEPRYSVTFRQYADAPKMVPP